MQHGSLNNQLTGTPKSIVPEVGMGATEIMWTDRHAYTVIEVLTPRKIVVQADRETRTDDYGMSECQEYVFERNPEGQKRVLSLRKTGQWVESKTKHGKFVLGSRGCYHDYSF